MQNKTEFVLLKLKEANVKQVERDTGIPATRIYKWLKGKGNPKVSDLDNIYNYFQKGTFSDSNEDVTKVINPKETDKSIDIAEVNPSDKNNIMPKEKVIPKGGHKVTDSGKRWEYEALPKPTIEAEPLHLSASSKFWDSDNPKFEELPDGTIRMRIPVIPYKAFAAGYLIGYSDPDYFEDLEYTTIEVLKRHQGYYLAFEIQGDSMTTLEPENFRQSIFDGVKVVGRELPRQQWRSKLHTHKWDFWIIVHKELGIMIKQIINHDVQNGVITIHSLNPDKSKYPDKDLYLDDIEQIFNMVKKIDE